MKTYQQILQSEMCTLIKNSCATGSETNPEYYSFQKALLKFFFGAVDVIIDYKAGCITLFKSEPIHVPREAIYQPETTTLVTINYIDLEATLKDCLEVGEKQIRFYESILFHFNHVTDGIGAWSA